MFGGIGVGEIAVVVLLLLLLFGAKRIPLIARGLGQGIRNFKSDITESDRLGDGESDDGEEPD